MCGQWDFESDETSSGAMFAVYDEYGHRLTEPYISEKSARLIAAAPDLLAALEDCALQIAQTRNRKLTYDEQSALDKARTALALARGAA